jgi:hypothetical protein
LPAGHPQGVVEVRVHGDPVALVVLHEVAHHLVVQAARDEDARPERRELQVLESAVVELLSCTKFPAISASCCGASRSESSVFGTMPAMLNRRGSLFTIARSPLALSR